MKRVSLILSFLFLTYLTGAFIAPLFAAPVSKLVEEGNQLYRKGKYSQAIRKYEQAAVDLPESAEIYFNEGNAYLSQGDTEKARKLLLQAAQKSTDIKLEARAKYNLGNLAFQEAKKYQDDNLKKAISKLEESARFYRETLDLDPTDNDAKYNIEIARIVMKDILDKLKKQQEKQKSRQKETNDLAEKLKKLIADQGKEIEKTKELETRKAAGNEELPDKTTEKIDKELKALTERQSKTREETGELTGKLRDLSRRKKTSPQQNSLFTRMAEHTDKANLAQAIAENELRKKQLTRAGTNEEEALQELNKALDLLKKPESPPSPSGGEKQGKKQKGKKEKKGKQKESRQAKKDETKKGKPEQKKVQITDTRARDILEEEKKNREERNLPRPGGYRPVDKDW